MKRALSSVAKLYFASIAISIISRAIFLLVHFGSTAELRVGVICEIFLRGLKLDLSTAGYITALPLLSIIVGAWGGWRVSPPVWRGALRLYLSLIAITTAFIVAIDANLYSYWGYRVDATLLPYLAEAGDTVASLTFGDVAISLTIFFVVLACSVWLYFRAVRSFEIVRLTLRQSALWTPTLLLIGGFLFLGIRGGVTDSVANVSGVYFSSIQYANHSAVNPLFSLVSSVVRVEDYDQMYPCFDEEELESNFTEIVGVTSSESEMLFLKKRPNVAIIICESYTRAIMDLSIDGREVMPNLNRIASGGIDFTNAYATGARTDRGVASALSGFPAQPKLSIMKIPAKSRNLPSIASSLAEEGYSSHFYYGGDLNFMDMSSYLYATGWGELTNQFDIKSEEAPRRWGYSDGVTMGLFGDEVIRLIEQSDHPILASLLTLSSHEPFDVPEDMGFEDKMINSMAYSDAKIGQMVEQWQASEIWDDLIVVIVADHAYSYPYKVGYNAPKRYRIPMIITGGALSIESRGRSESRFVSQIDIAATLLSQMGIDHSDYLFSRDYFDTARTADSYFGYYAFSDGFGVVDESGAVIYDNIGGSYDLTSYDSTTAISNGTTEASEGDAMKLKRGKTILQKTHLEIDRM